MIFEVVSVAVVLCYLCLLHIIRHFFHAYVKKKYAYYDPRYENRFKTNKAMVHFDTIMAVLIVLLLATSFVVLDRLHHTEGKLEISFIILLTACHVVSTVPLIPVLRKMHSFFYWDDVSLEFNLCIDNRESDTVKMQNQNIASISKSEDSYIIHTRDKKQIPVKMTSLEILKGYRIIIDKLDSHIRNV